MPPPSRKDAPPGRLIGIALLAALILGLGPQAAPAAETIKVIKPQMRPIQRPEPRPAQAGPEFGGILQAVDRARSMAEVQRALEGAKLSPAQSRRLGQLLAQPPYQAKLERLQAQAGFKEEPRARTGQASGQVILKKRREDLRRAYDKSLARANRSFRSHMVAVRPSPGQMGVQVRVPRRARGAVLSAADRRSLGAAATRGSIASVSPHRVPVGGRLTITGREFGPNPGQVTLLIGRQGHPSNLVPPWRDDRIVVEIPPEMASVVGGADTPARLWVRPPGQATGPTAEITLLPNRDLLVPVITRVSGDQIIPRQSFAIQGANFLGTGQGKVFFSFAGKRLQAEVRSWNDTAIEIQVPDIYGLMREAGWLIVANHLGLEAQAPVTFIPRIVTSEYRSPGDRGRGYTTVSCSPYHGQTGSDDAAWLVCVVGHKKKYTTQIWLRNGWSVYDVKLERFERWGRSGARCGAFFRQEPLRGRSGHLESKATVWANGWCRCRYIETWYLEGPNGVPWDKDYDPSRACVDTQTRRPEMAGWGCF